ncbi:unnamed protein product [Candidula unifasciata]|uniref:Beta-lactamase-related domain-containing protein n=1 Tax=Candidula unifasciata TaxID=100452 RepID=A0A8S3ZIT8_9EUPU|nr:unnamed protein product [Candidula unifasciata]
MKRMNSGLSCDVVKPWQALFGKLPKRLQFWKSHSYEECSAMSVFQTTVLLVIVAVCWSALPSFFTCSTTATYDGYVHPDFQEVKDVFGGLVDYSHYVHGYWPEFRQTGKENVTLGMLLSHQAGLVSLDRQLSLLEYRDNWAEIEELMAKSKPAWPPGTRYSYHAYTYGMFADAVVRKVDTKHRNISQFFKEEIAEPFGIDFHVGLPPELHHRVARGRFTPIWELLAGAFLLKPYRWKWLPELLPGSTVHRSMNVFDIMNDMNVMNDPELQAIGMPSAVGFGTARSLAELYDYLANEGSIHGRQLLSKRQVAALSTPATENIPVIAVPDEPFAMGTAVGKSIQGRLIFGHRGYGGQNAFADPGNRLGVSYVTNFNSRYSDTDDPRVIDLLRVFYKCMHKYSLRNQKR